MTACKWTPEEKAIVRQYYRKGGSRACLARLEGRSVRGIQKCAERIGVEYETKTKRRKPIDKILPDEVLYMTTPQGLRKIKALRISGVVRTMAEWAEHPACQITANGIRSRIKRQGKTPYVAVFSPCVTNDKHRWDVAREKLEETKNTAPLVLPLKTWNMAVKEPWVPLTVVHWLDAMEAKA